MRKNITRVELDWLGLSLNDLTALVPPDLDDIAEDGLGLRLMQLGGRWWKSKDYYAHHINQEIFSYGHHYPPDLDVGYPASGGVLVLRTWADNSAYDRDMPDIPPEKPENWTHLTLCATMEERCEMLRGLGAEWYASVEECHDLPSTIDEGVARERWFEELMDKMDDWGCVDRWLSSLEDRRALLE